MDSIKYLYKDISNRSFDFVIIDGNNYSIIKVINFLKSIKDSLYNDNNIREFYKKMVLIKLNEHLIVQKKSIFIKEFITYINKLDSLLITPISSLEEEEENTRSRIRTDQEKPFEDQKGSGYVNLTILLSKIYINDSLKRTNIEQLIKHLYDNKQITKQV